MLKFLMGLLLLIVFIAATYFAFTKIESISPLPVGSPTANGIAALGNFYTYVDTGTIFLVFAVLFIDIYHSFRHPSEVKAIANVVFIFILGFVNTTLVGAAASFNLAIPANSLVPNLFGFFVSDYKVLLLYFVAIVCVILNLRGRDE